MKKKAVKPAKTLFQKLVEKRFGVEVLAEYKFHPGRKWRADFAIPEHKILIEQEGGIFMRGRHVRPMGFLRDMDKYNNAAAMGYSVLRVTPTQLTSPWFLTLVGETILNK